MFRRRRTEPDNKTSSFVIDLKTPETASFAGFLLGDETLKNCFQSSFDAGLKLLDAKRVEIKCVPGTEQRLRIGFGHLRARFKSAVSTLDEENIITTAHRLRTLDLSKDQPGTLDEKFAMFLGFHREVNKQLLKNMRQPDQGR